MQAAFWHQRWQDNQIGFHLPSPHPLLSDQLKTQSLADASTVFVPLCGKTVDIAFLLESGYQVRAIELSKLAVEQLFESMGLQPTIIQQDDLQCYSVEGLSVYVGDVFNLSQSRLGVVDWVYDRAALVALPHAMRLQYVSHLQQITNQAPQLLITIEYDQAVMEGPPFAINGDMVEDYYQQAYECQLINQQAVDGGLKGKVEAVEKLWFLKKK